MIKTKRIFNLGVLCLAMGVTAVANAKVSPEEAAKIGTELTAMGANPAGNAAGTIPAYTGEIFGAPDWVDYKGTGTYYPNPYPDEEPLFTISGQNYRDFEANLTDGQIAMFQKYPDTFKMPIYPSKRDSRYNDWFHEQVKLNAVNTVLVEGGNGIKYGFGATPFPLPKNGQELIWNHVYAPNPYATSGSLMVAAVFDNGSQSLSTRVEDRYFQVMDPNVSRDSYDDVAAMVLAATTSPAREKGKVVLVHEYSNLTETPRNAWQYLPGTRRVRRAPTISYDFPDGPGGLRTVDDALLFNGATDRYTWKMEPMRELYVPYNNYDMDDPKYSYNDLLTVHHLNPKPMRYELHRCWVVVGELKSGKRHIYAKRRIYMEEDSWHGLLADNYDGQGNLWRTNMRTFQNLYDMPGMGPRIEIYHDLQKGAYLANGLVNEEGGVPKNVDEIWPLSYFTPANLRKLGLR
ncbi:MAG: DUF1329 domain-containing protein [Pseudomonadales bacterium]|nr:DUF1329 domain-containing protein [Pseudomonadales bacterium]